MAFWHSPADQPRWARPLLLGIAGGGTARDAVTSWVESACRSVPAQDYGGSSSGTLYACFA